MGDITDLHAILFRVDQLEKLVVSQAREIDLLKRLVSTTQIALNNINPNHHQHQQFARNTAHNFTNPPPQSQSGQSYSLATNHINNNNNNNNSDNSNATNNMQAPPTNLSQQPVYRPQTFLMNPLVHPPTAIPPMAHRPASVVNSENRMAAKTLSNGLLHQLPPRGQSQPPPQQQPISMSNHTNNPTLRWSTAETLKYLQQIDRVTPSATTDNMNPNQDLETDENGSPIKRQSFVEIRDEYLREKDEEAPLAIVPYEDNSDINKTPVSKRHKKLHTDHNNNTNIIRQRDLSECKENMPDYEVDSIVACFVDDTKPSYMDEIEGAYTYITFKKTFRRKKQVIEEKWPWTAENRPTMPENLKKIINNSPF